VSTITGGTESGIHCTIPKKVKVFKAVPSCAFAAKGIQCLIFGRRKINRGACEGKPCSASPSPCLPQRQSTVDDSPGRLAVLPCRKC
jgi:hypothetical protein